MRAAVVGTTMHAPALEVRDVPDPMPHDDWVVVRLRRAALNRLDAMMLDARANEAPGTIFGSDGSGVIAAHGPDVPASAGLAPGTEVIISPSLFWGPRDDAPGENYEILGSPTHGTHAQLVVVPAANVHVKPGHLSFDEAAALPMAGLTAWRALVTRGRLTAGETVVIGAASSGVGTLGIQIAAAEGARVVAITSSRDKAREAVDLGAERALDRTAPGFAEELRLATDGGVADLALDPTGALWQPLVDVLRPGGRLVVVGMRAAPTAELRVQSVYWKQVDVLGSSMGSPRDFAALLAHVATHRWSPVVDSVFPLEDITAAYERLDSTERIGKVVLDLE